MASGRIAGEEIPESVMKNFKKLVLAAAVVVLFMAPCAFADSVVTFNGSYSFGNNGVGIPPYGGTLDGQAAEFYCVDYSHDISGGDSWDAIVTPVTTNPAGYGSTYLQSETDYLEFVWLIEQEMGTDPANQDAIAADQWAIWSVSGGNDPYTGPTDSASYLLSEAQTAVADGFNGAGWEILTPDSANGSYGQEFLVQTPEPSALALVGIGLFGLFFVKRRDWLGLGGAAERSDS